MPGTVLLVEDDENIAILVRYVLESEGYTVVHATDGRRAGTLIKNSPPPALAMLDVMVPFADGFTLVERIRSSRTWSGVPIIVLTAKTAERDQVRAFELGADDFITKPFQPEALAARVRRLIRLSA